jgi:NAD-dependent deacetylase
VRVKCLAGCGVVEPAVWRADARRPPRCPACAAPLRPDVVWFGELLPEQAMRRAQRAVAACDAMLVVGTSALVYPAAQLPHDARDAGAALIVVDPGETPLDAIADASLRARAGDAVPALLDGLA